jgi:hypothetical protein
MVDPAIPMSLVPREVWNRRRNCGKDPSFADRFYICHLCSEAGILRDPNISVKPCASRSRVLQYLGEADTVSRRG